VNAFGLPGGARIGKGEVFVVEEVRVIHAGAGRVDVGLPPASVVLLERVLLLGDLDAYFLSFGSPEAEAMHYGISSLSESVTMEDTYYVRLLFGLKNVMVQLHSARMKGQQVKLKLGFQNGTRKYFRNEPGLDLH
jgi:hypothetical protein